MVLVCDECHDWPLPKRKVFVSYNNSLKTRRTPWQTPRGADFGLSRVGPRGSGSKSPVFVGNGGRQASGLTVGGVFTSTDQCVPTLREAAPP